METIDRPDDLEPTAPRRRRLRLPRIRRRWVKITALILVVLAVVIGVASFFIDEPLRKIVEQRMNKQMQGYTASIHRLSFHPIGLSLTLRGLEFVQNSHPVPPVLNVPRLDAHVHWKALLSGSVVAEFDISRPKLYVDRTHLIAEAKDPTPLDQHGWQAAFEAIYPLKINHVRIIDGEATYVDRGQPKPIRLDHLNVMAENIRNVHSRERDYPSDLHLDAIIFDTGKIVIDGNADFLAEPYAGIKADLALNDIQLEYAKPILQEWGVLLKRGVLSANGHVEYAPTIKVADLKQATFRDLTVEYIHTPKNVGGPQKVAQQTVKSTKEASNQPDLYLRIRDLRITNGTIGIQDKTGDHPYRVFLTNTDVAVQNFSNQRSEGIGSVRLHAKFMGSGDTTANVAFRPESKGPNFDVDLKVENTDLTKLNDLLRAYGKFDVASGQLSVYSEMKVHDGRVDGYVKPLFSDVKVSAPETQDEKSFGQKVKEKVIGAAFKILKNIPRREVATKVDISGPLEAPQTDKWQVIRRLLKNAFIKAILPGFDREVAGKGVRQPASGQASPRTEEREKRRAQAPPAESAASKTETAKTASTDVNSP